MAIGSYRHVWIAAAILPMLSWCWLHRRGLRSCLVRQHGDPPRPVPGQHGCRRFRRILRHRVWVIAAFLVRASRLLALQPKLRAHRVRHRVHDYTLSGQRICRSFRRQTVLLSASDRVRRTCRLSSHTSGVARFHLDGGRRCGAFPADSSVTSLVTQAADRANVPQPWRRDVRVGPGVAVGAHSADLLPCLERGPFVLGAVAALIGYCPGDNPKRERALVPAGQAYSSFVPGWIDL